MSCRRQLFARGCVCLFDNPARRGLPSHRIKIPDHGRASLLSSTTVRSLRIASHFGRQALDHPIPLFRQIGGVLFPNTKLAGDEKSECDRHHTAAMIFTADAECEEEPGGGRGSSVRLAAAILGNRPTRSAMLRNTASSNVLPDEPKKASI